METQTRLSRHNKFISAENQIFMTTTFSRFYESYLKKKEK